jgi:hypothetical protein
VALPIFFLAVRHFHMEGETAEWLVSMWPRSVGEVALEDRRAAADMVISYGELAGASMLTYTIVGWSALFFGEGSDALAREILRCAQDDGGRRSSSK